MKIFLAGLSEVAHTRKMGAFMKARGLTFHELLSYIKAQQTSIWNHAMALSESRTEFFLDSGAYTAWTKGTIIDVEVYAAFVVAHADTFAVVANLDVIPGSPGRVATPLEIEASAAQGWKNYATLRDSFKAWEDEAGRAIPFNFLHTYHQGENVAWLERLLKHGDPYIAISPGNDRTTDQKMYWLDGIMPLLVDDKGWPTVKFHGFGVTALELLQRYPWYSVDSTSWVLFSRYGIVQILIGGKLYNVTFSNQSPRAQYEGRHFTTFCKRDQHAIRAYLEHIDFTPEELAEDFVARDHANMLFYLELERTWTSQPFERPRARPRFSL